MAHRMIGDAEASTVLKVELRIEPVGLRRAYRGCTWQQHDLRLQSDPTNKKFFRPRATARSARSAALLSISSVRIIGEARQGAPSRVRISNGGPQISLFDDRLRSAFSIHLRRSSSSGTGSGLSDT